MTIQPLKGIVYLKIDEAKAGVLDTSSKKSAVEVAEVIAIGGSWQGTTKYGLPGVDEGNAISYGIQVGDKIFVKAWAIDQITHEGKTHYFVNIETKGILAIIK